MFSCDYVGLEAQDAPLPEKVTKHAEDASYVKKRGLYNMKSPCNSLKRKVEEFARDIRPPLLNSSKRQRTQMVPESTECRLCDLTFQTDLELEEHFFSILHHRAIDTREKGARHDCTLCATHCPTLNIYIQHLRSWAHKANYAKRESEITAGTYRISFNLKRSSKSGTSSSHSSRTWKQNNAEPEECPADNRWHRQNHSVSWDRSRQTGRAAPTISNLPPKKSNGWDHNPAHMHHPGFPNYQPWRARQESHWIPEQHTWWDNPYAHHQDYEWWNDDLPPHRQFEEEHHDRVDNHQRKFPNPPRDENQRMMNLLAQARETIHCSKLTSLPNANGRGSHPEVAMQKHTTSDSMVSSTTGQAPNSRSCSIPRSCTNPAQKLGKKYNFQTEKRPNSKSNASNYSKESMQAQLKPKTCKQGPVIKKSLSGAQSRAQDLASQAARAKNAKKPYKTLQQKASASTSNLGMCKYSDTSSSNSIERSFTESESSVRSISLHLPRRTHSSPDLTARKSTSQKSKNGTVSSMPSLASSSSCSMQNVTSRNEEDEMELQSLSNGNLRSPMIVTTVTTVQQDLPISLKDSLTPDMFKEFQKQIDIDLALHPERSSLVKDPPQKNGARFLPATSSGGVTRSSSWAPGVGNIEGMKQNGEAFPGSTPCSSRQPDMANNIRKKFLKILDEIDCNDNLQKLKKEAEEYAGLQSTEEVPLTTKTKANMSSEGLSTEESVPSTSQHKSSLPNIPATSDMTLNLTETVYLPTVSNKDSNNFTENSPSLQCVQRTCTSDIDTPSSKKRTNPQPNINKARSRLSSKHKDSLSPDISSDVRQAKLRKLLHKYNRAKKTNSTSPETVTPSRNDNRKAAGPRFGIDLNLVNRSAENFDEIASLATSGEFVEVTNNRSRSFSESDGTVAFTTAATDSVINLTETVADQLQNTTERASPTQTKEKGPENYDTNAQGLNSRLLVMSEREEDLHAAIRSLDVEDANMQAEIDRTVGVINELQIQLTKLQERKATILAVKQGNETELGKLRQERLRLLRGTMAGENVSPNPGTLFQDVTPNCRRFVGMPRTHSTPTPQNDGSFNSTKQSLSESYNQGQQPFSAPFSNIASPEVSSTVSEPSVNPVTHGGVSQCVAVKSEPGLGLADGAFPQPHQPVAVSKLPGVKQECIQPPAPSFHGSISGKSNDTNTLTTIGAKSLQNGSSTLQSSTVQDKSSDQSDLPFRTTCGNSRSNTSAEFYSFASCGELSSTQDSADVDRILAKYTQSSTTGNSAGQDAKKQNLPKKKTIRTRTRSTPTNRRRSPRTGAKTPQRQVPQAPRPEKTPDRRPFVENIGKGGITTFPSTLKSHNASLVGMNLTSSGLLTCSLDESLAFHDTETGKKFVLGLEATPTAMTAFYNGRDVVCVAMQKVVSSSSPSNPYVVVKKMENILCLYTIKASGSSLEQVTFHPVEKIDLKTRVLCMQADNGMLFCGMRDGMVALIPLSETNKVIDEVEVLECHSHSAVTCLTTGTEGVRRILCCGSTDCTVSVRDANDGLLLRSIQGHTKTVTCLQLVHHELFSAGVDRQVLGHDLNTGRLLHRFVGHAGVVRSLSVAGTCMITLCSDRHIRFYNTENCRLMHKPKQAPSLPLFSCVKTSENGCEAYIGCQDGTILQRVPFPTAGQEAAIEISPARTPNRNSSRQSPAVITAKNIVIDLAGDYECRWAGCKHRSTFLTEEKLREHVLSTHANLYDLTEYALDRASMTLSVGTCCQWDQCTHYFAPELDTIVDVHTHVQRHFQK